MGHLQVFPFIHYQLNEFQRELNTFSLFCNWYSGGGGGV
jgi:hypothetical protein